MKIGIVSDTHLGFAAKTERFNDSFDALKQGFNLLLKKNVDFILMPGDLFDHSIPSQETLHEAFKLFSIPKKVEKSNVKVFRNIEGEKKELQFEGIPVLAIHGTHEFRGKGYKTALDVLSSAGFMIYFHAETLFVEMENEKVAVQGLGGVPEKKALDVLKMFNPKPIEGNFNIFVFHQSLKEFLPTQDEMSATMSLEDLPKNFQLYINGHLHWHSFQNLNSGKFLLPGSTIFTQMKKLESEKPKGVIVFDTEKNDFEFLPLPKQRKLFYHKLKFENSTLDDVKGKVLELLKKDLSKDFQIKPLIRFKLTGSLSKGLNQADLDLQEFLKDFEEKAIVSVSKKFYSQEFKSKIEELRKLQKDKKSVSALGLDILEKNLEETDFKKAFNVKELFSYLEKGDLDKAMKFLEENSKKQEIA